MKSNVLEMNPFKAFVLFIVAIALMAMLGSCTDNQRARKWGGTENIALPSNEVILTMTWKGDQLWVLSKDTTTGVSHFREHSSWGFVQGEVTIK